MKHVQEVFYDKLAFGSRGNVTKVTEVQIEIQMAAKNVDVSFEKKLDKVNQPQKLIERERKESKSRPASGSCSFVE